MDPDCDPRAELRELIAELPQANRRVEAALNADPSDHTQVGEAFRRYVDADRTAAAIRRRIRELYESLGRG